MKKILLLRSLDISVVNPHIYSINQYAKMKENELVLDLAYADGLPEDNPTVTNAEKYFEGKVHYFPANASVEQLAQFIVENKYDAVVSISMPDSNNFRDSQLKLLLEREYNIKVIAHPLESCTIMCDKYLTEKHLQENGFNAIKSYLINTWQEAISVSSVIQYPLVVKPINLCLSEAVEVIHNENQLSRYFERFGYSKIIQKFIKGTQISVEVIGFNKSYQSMVAVSKEETDFGEQCPLEKFRIGPVKQTIASNNELCRISENIAESLNIEGAIEIEFIVSDDGIYVMEINPRTSGITNLSIASTGLNTYILLIEMAQGRFDKSSLEKKTNYACEFPIKNEISYEDFTYLLKLPEVVHFERNKPEWFDTKENSNLMNFGRFYITGEDKSQIIRALKVFEGVTKSLDFNDKISSYI